MLFGEEFTPDRREFAIAFSADDGYTSVALVSCGGGLSLATGAVSGSADVAVGRGAKHTAATRKTVLAAVVVALAVIAVGGIAWQRAIWPLNQGSAAALARRAQYFWDLRLSGDSLGAYNYMVESYRRRVDPVGFARTPGMVVWTGAKVKDVRLDEKGGLVDIELKYRLARKNFADMESSNVVTERWIIEDGAWHRWPPEAGG